MDKVGNASQFFRNTVYKTLVSHYNAQNSYLKVRIRGAINKIKMELPNFDKKVN